MDLKVTSINLWDGGKLLEEALDFITQIDPDILALQEVYNGKSSSLAARFRTLDILRSRLNYTTYNYAPEFIDNLKEGRICQGNAIFSKFPILESTTTFFDRPFDEHYVELPENFPTISHNLQGVLLNTPVGKVHFFNFHGVWDLDGDNFSESRKKMSKTIIDAVSDKKTVILAGDTNAKPTNKAMRDIERKLKSVFGDTVTTTFNMRRKNNPGYATAAVDMIFVSRSIEILDRTVPDVDISDHLPLVVRLHI